ncbi:MAG: hypothetical protein ACREJX_08240, partial [Polyangiaceae bacterium]
MRLGRRASMRATLSIGAVAALLTLAPARALASDADDKAASAQHDVQTASREIPSVQAAVSSAQTQLLTVEQRLANGDILYQSKDYVRASVVYS